jgi:photosystem II stability/assembly factor-like uncharacterized protein
MKKYLFFSALVLGAINAKAQPWMPKDNVKRTFTDIVEAYRAQVGEKEEEKGIVERAGGVIEEDEKYHFGRWSWYWKNHLDSAGYLVPGFRTALAWEDYKRTHGIGRKAAKGTATDNWSFIGPDKSNGGYSGIGRVNVVAFHPTDSNIIYVGSGGGSTWKTTNGGTTWTALYNDFVSLCVSDVAVNPLNGNTVYVVTGDANGGSDYSIGVLKSYDGGTNWANIGPSTWTLDSFRMARSLVINPVDTNKLILGTSNGLYKSSDGGATWFRTATFNVRQVLYCPNDTAVVYAAAIMSSGAQIYKSTNGGFTWNPITSITGSSRMNIAVSPAAPGVIMGIACNSSSGLRGVYRSTDYGGTVIEVTSDNVSCTNNMLNGENELPTSNCGGQGWYDLCIAIDPTDADKVIIGGINNFYSVDGGLSWDICNTWYNTGSGVQVVHADKHWLAYNPLNRAIYLGCDGGIYKTYNPVINRWKDISNGLGITQFYRNAVHNDVTYCLGGAQDNGTKKLAGGVYTDLTGGDGMHCLISNADPANIFFTATQYGNVRVTYDGGANFNSITEDLPTPGAWITPYIQHPVDPNILYIGYKQIFRTTDAGGSWEPISPIFSSGANIEFLAISFSNPDYIYAVRDAGSVSRIHYTTNGGTSWLDIVVPFSAFISDIVVDPKNEKKFYVTLGGFIAAKVYSYDLTTSTWTNESTGLPALPVNCMAIDTFSMTKYVGTEVAVFYKTKEMTSWALYNSNLPSVQVTDLNINHTTNEIYAATYGRGMWRSGKAEITPPVGVKQIPALLQRISVSPNPCRGAFTIQTPGATFRNTQVSVRLIATDGRSIGLNGGTVDNAGKVDVTLENVPAGFYICEIGTEKGTMRTKLVVE